MAKEYIDREVAIEAIKNDLPNIVNYRKADAMECLEILPAVDVEVVRHGEWETVNGIFTPGGDPLKRCPFCKSKESEHLDGVEFPNNWLYCPKCGAKMDGKKVLENSNE